MLRLLFLVQDEQRAILDRLYDGVASACHCDLRRLDRDEQKQLKAYFKNIDVNAYDCILMMTRAKYAMKQTRFLKTLPNLAFLEHDAWQNYTSCKYKGQFSKFYKQLPGCNVVSSGFNVTNKLQQEGIHARFVPKGYDQTLLANLHNKRDIECAFVGSVKNSIYKERSEFLNKLQRTGEVQLLHTASGDDYLQTLNRIHFFISADIGFGEYMLKNFEAMACGCVVFAYDQGQAENDALCFKNMKNIVLYRSLDELRQKLLYLRQHPHLAASIQQAGQALAEQHYSFADIGKKIAGCLSDIYSNKTAK